MVNPSLSRGLSLLGTMLASLGAQACFYQPTGIVQETESFTTAMIGSTGDPLATTDDGPTQTSGQTMDTTAAPSDMSTDATDTTVTTVTGTSGPPDTTIDPRQLPEATQLQLAFSPIKQFDFNWSPASGAQYYQLVERITPEQDYVQIAGDIVGEATSLTMPLHMRFGASYVLRACNTEGCTDSEPVEVVDSLASAVGYLKASSTGSEDYMGRQLTLSADGNTLAVGSDGEDSAATGIDGDQGDNSVDESGAVYVFVRDGETWAQQAYIKASNTDTYDNFGSAVALSADGSTLAVGAREECSGATGVDGDQSDDSTVFSGAVYVFTRDGQTWSQQAYVKASNTGAGDRFGSSVSLSADGDTLAVGAMHEDSITTGVDGDQADNSAGNSGAAYMFVRTGGVWSQQAYIKASNTDSGDEFGRRLILSADGDTLAVGAPWEDSASMGINSDKEDDSAIDAGAAYVFVRTDGTWKQQAYVKATNTGAGDLFGVSIGLSGDGDTLAIGAYEDSGATGVQGEQSDNTAEHAGAVYVFARVNKIWSQQAFIKSSNNEEADGFGSAVALSFDGDLLVVGATNEDGGAVGVAGERADNSVEDSGAVYVLVRDGADWTQRSYVKASNTTKYYYFGEQVVVSADGTTVAVSSPSESSAATGVNGDQLNTSGGASGAVYLF